MPKQLKVTASITFVLAILFYLFFQITKHQPALSQVNAFAEDPFDAIGSFGFQLAACTAFLSLIRAFRPYQPNKTLDDQQLLLLRAEYLSCLTIAVTLGADIVAMVRYPSLWMGLPAGYTLAALIGGMALLTALVSWLISRSTRTTIVPSVRSRWTRALAIVVVSILILALYPANWRQSVPGALLTVLVGAVILFMSVWALVTAITPPVETQFEDLIDDLASVYRWLKAHTGHFIALLNIVEKMRELSFIRSILEWLNPRKHTWNACILIGIFMGLVLALAEAFGEGGLHQLGRFAPVAAVFVSLEAAAVLLGYAFLASPLGLFRQDTNYKRS